VYSLSSYSLTDSFCRDYTDDMSGISRFTNDEVKRIKRLKESERKNYNCIAQIINRDRSSDRYCTPRGVRTCLKKSDSSSKRVYKRKLGFAALALIDAQVNADREISARELQKSLQEKLDINVSTSVINRERRRMGWVQTSTRYCQMIRAENKEKRLLL